MKLRTKFGLLTCSLSLIVVAGVSVFFYIGERNLLLNELSESRSSAAADLSGVGRESIISSNQIQLINYITGLMRDDTVVYAAVTDAGGRVLAHSDVNMLGSALPGFRVGMAEGTYRDEQGGEALTVSVSPVVVSGEERGYATVAFSIDRISRMIDSVLEKTRERVMGVAWAGLVLGLLGALLLSSMMTKPIRKMAEGAVRIGSGKLDTVIDVRSRDELGSLAKTINTMANQLEELDRMKQDFVSSITHEFRSPLNAMAIHFDLLAGERLGPVNEKQKDSLNVLKNNARRLEKFINALLDIAKLERGKMEVNPEPFNLKETIEETVKLYSANAEKKNIGLSFRSGELPTVKADPDRTCQVIANLLSNAIKFTPEGGKVQVSAEAGKVYVTVSVSDSGMGIPSDQIGTIFNKFEQVKGIRQQIKGQKGTGLGLAIVKGLVEQQGGEIRVESEEGKGTVFTFTVPVDK